MESTWLTEFDLVDIGDEAQLNADCTIQTHLFEDRVMKMDRIAIGDRCSVGMDSVVLYGSRMEPRSVLGDLSLLMKGETLPEGTRWEGSPARPAHRLALPLTLVPPMHGGNGHDEARIFLDPGGASTPVPAELDGDLVMLSPDGLGRPRAR